MPNSDFSVASRDEFVRAFRDAYGFSPNDIKVDSYMQSPAEVRKEMLSRLQTPQAA
jgi:AraC-like DNA-binding protein